MLKQNGERYEHEKFKRLCALAASSSLAPLELAELQAHLQACEDCREVFLQYRALSTYGMSSLADGYVERRNLANWDEASALQRVMQRVQAERQVAVTEKVSVPARANRWRGIATHPLTLSALAACLIVVVGFGSYRFGAAGRTQLAANLAPTLLTLPAADGLRKPSEEKRAADEAREAQGKKLELLRLETSDRERELVRLRGALSALEERANQLVETGAQTQAQLKTLSQQRDALNVQLQAVSRAYDTQKSELVSLLDERDRTALHSNTLEAKIDDLTAMNRDQERRLKDAEQYLSSDRDIRELMGARKLYIADVFDVDGSSRTQRPFGRVFYTQGKSLIFYAFDLDREPGVVNASAFQVWGQREAPQGEQASPMNLGILYKDNETNRRWVMRFDEPKQLAEIDAVFVTVEPRGGSHKPTSKPFLYALLRNEANHP
jgi:hypothetical protein